MRPKHLERAKPIPVKLDGPLLERIDAMASKIGEAKSTVMRMAMRIGLDGLEKAFDASPADLLKLVSGLKTSKNLSSSNVPGGGISGEDQKPGKIKRPAA
jgi:hypothetical protein